MKDSLQPGIENVLEVTVTPEMSPPHLPVKVLSTPSMVQLMEQTCLLSAAPHLDEAETTVGTHICVSTSRRPRPARTWWSTTKLVEVVKRRLRFEVSVKAGDRLLGEGTHDRAVIDTTRFAS